MIEQVTYQSKIVIFFFFFAFVFWHKSRRFENESMQNCKLQSTFLDQQCPKSEPWRSCDRWGASWFGTRLRWWLWSLNWTRSSRTELAAEISQPPSLRSTPPWTRSRSSAVNSSYLYHTHTLSKISKSTKSDQIQRERERERDDRRSIKIGADLASKTKRLRYIQNFSYGLLVGEIYSV